MPVPLHALGIVPADARQQWQGRTLTEHVVNVGREPVTVTTRVVVLGKGCAETPVTGLTVIPPKVSVLPPGHEAVFLVTAVPSGTGDYGVVFDSAPIGVHGSRAGTGVGAQILTRGAVSCVHPKAVVARPVASGGFPWAYVAIPLALLIVLGALLRTMRRSRRTP